MKGFTTIEVLVGLAVAALLGGAVVMSISEPEPIVEEEVLGAPLRVTQYFQGGTSTSTRPSDGHLLAGDPNGGYGLLELIAGTNITLSSTTVSSGLGSLTISSSGGSAVGALTDLTDVTLTGTSTGDTLYNNSSGQWVNLAAGIDGKVLKLSGGIPSWADDDAGAGAYSADVILTDNLSTLMLQASTTGQVWNFPDGFISNASSTVIGDFTVENPTSTTTLNSGLTIETSGFVYDFSTNNVGIGNASPQELLHVGAGTDSSDITATDLLVTRAGASNLSVRDSTNDVETFLFSSSVGGVMGTVTNDPLNIKTNNTNAIFIDASQNVGIGDVTPTYKLDVTGLARFTGLVDASHFVATSSSDFSIFEGGFVASASSTINSTLTVTATTTLEAIRFLPEHDQTITAASDQVSASSTVTNLCPDADYVLTSVPTIASSTPNTMIILHNRCGFDLDFQDNSVLSGSGIYNAGVDSILEPDNLMTLLFMTDADQLGNPGWKVQSHPNPTTAAGAAEVLDVRNVSGGTLTALTPVYATGFNVGQNRTTVDAADADDPAKMPAIGIVNADIGNNSNGDIITFGEMESQNTSSFSTDDLLYVDTTAGGLTASRPNIDDVQLIGEVLRAHATQGIFLVFGAGRANDLPNNATTTIFFSGDLMASIASFGETASSTFDGAGVLVVVNSGTLDADGFDLLTGNDYEINGASVLTATTLGGAVVGSSLTGVGTVTSGTWNSLFAAGLIDGDDMNANYAGRSLTETAGSPDTLDADAELYTRIITFSIASSSMSTTTDVTQHKFSSAITISRISCTTNVGAGTSTINFFERTELEPSSAGTQVVTADLACGANHTNSTTSFDNAGIAADAPLSFEIADAENDIGDTGPGSTPVEIRVHVDYTYDD